jgi:hypothetical protein
VLCRSAARSQGGAALGGSLAKLLYGGGTRLLLSGAVAKELLSTPVRARHHVALQLLFVWGARESSCQAYCFVQCKYFSQEHFFPSPLLGKKIKAVYFGDLMFCFSFSVSYCCRQWVAG